MSDEEKHAQGRGHYKLEAWKHARELVLSVYRFARERLFCLPLPFTIHYSPFTASRHLSLVTRHVSRFLGVAREGEREFAQFLNIARGSLSELETQLLIATDLGYIKADDPVFKLVDLFSRLLTGLRKSIKR